MLTQAAFITLRILFFRSGPEDFPFSKDGRLTAACVALAVLANALLVGMLMPAPVAVIAALINVGFLGLLTRALLATRRVPERFQQTFNALLASTGVLTLAMAPFIAQIAPVWVELTQQLQQNPDLINHPDQWPQMPVLVDRMLMMLGIWQIAVFGFVFYRAAGARSLIVLALVLGGMMLLTLSMRGIAG